MSALEEIMAVARIMAGFPHPWFVSGGWAIDLFVGRVTREHGDREVGIFRQDQQALWEFLTGRTLYKGVTGPNGGAWVAWEGEWLALPLHQILVRPPDLGPLLPDWEPGTEEFEFFLNEVQDGVWRCRRNLELTRPVEELYQTSASGIPIIAPEIQLLYKARHHRPKDEHDFRQALPLLSPGRRGWLKEALALCYGQDAWVVDL